MGDQTRLDRHGTLSRSEISRRWLESCIRTNPQATIPVTSCHG
jgi:hypothetical protein